MIAVTDGDAVACAAVETAARELGLRTISASAGNPTRLTGERIAELCQTTPHDPVVVMVDDRGANGMGAGERALAVLLAHPRIEVLGVIAVASNTRAAGSARVHASVTAAGEVVPAGVGKDGHRLSAERVRGDTVDALDALRAPLVIGLGDLGKMGGADLPGAGAPVTRRAIAEILRRSGLWR